MALTVWQSDGFGSAAWRGDAERWGKYFVEGVGYVQGDAAIRYADGAFTFHGRSDEARFFPALTATFPPRASTTASTSSSSL